MAEMKTPFKDAIEKSFGASATYGNREGAQLATSDLASGTDMGLPIVQFDEVSPAPIEVKEIMPNVFGMKLGKGLKG